GLEDAAADPRLRRDDRERRTRADELLHEAELRVQVLDRRAGAARKVRLTEVDDRRRLVRPARSHRDAQADHRADDRADDEQPPARSDDPRVAPEVDLLLDVELGQRTRPRVDVEAHRVPTVAQAHSHWAVKPSSSETLG